MKKRFFLAAMTLLVSMGAFAQGNGIAGISEATNMVTSYFDPGTKLIYAIGAVIGLIGGVKVYSKFSSGDPDTSKTAASWFGACIFLIVAATILRSFFLEYGEGSCQQGNRSQPGVQGTQEPVPVRLCRRAARPVRGVRHHVHGRHRPVGLHRFRCHRRLGARVGDLPHEREVRRMGADEAPGVAQASPLHHQPEKISSVVFPNL